MSRRTIVVTRIDQPNAPVPVQLPTGRILELWIDTPNPSSAVLQQNVWSRLSRQGYVPPIAAVDLFRVASAVFAADLRVKRNDAFEGWTRDLSLYLPVTEVDRWESVRKPLLKLLAFLTGDHWEVAFYPAVRGLPAPRVRSRRRTTPRPFAATAACLLSGGLDSFIGASDALANGELLALVSHYAKGTNVAASPAQTTIAEALSNQYGEQAFHHFGFSVTAPKQNFTEISEDTTRSRSIMFLALGALVASAYPVGAGGVRRLIVPENGLISLNAPLTDNRLGSLSTKTTHPHTLALFREMLEGLGLKVQIEMPYQLTTKGEMLVNSHNRTFVERWARSTVSCARPTQTRWLNASKREADPRVQRSHCGYCVPCIIRRSAMSVAGIDFVDDYRRDVHAPEVWNDSDRRADAAAFRLAIARLRAGKGPVDVLSSGPLQRSAHSIAEFIDVHRRGLEEVATFLDQTRERQSSPEV